MYRHGRKQDETSELTISEFRRILLISLGKLNSKDTAKLGTDELASLAQRLNPGDESISIFVNTILENSDKQTTSSKKETIRVIAVTASIHREDLINFLPKIMQNICKNLRDRDTSVRDTTVEAIGTICMHVHITEGKDFFGIYLKPLFKLMTEQNKSVQVGGALAIASVIKNSPVTEIVALLERIMSGFQKLVAPQSFLAKSAIYIAMSSLIEACKLNAIPIVPTMIHLVKEGFQSSDWNDRKEAVETVRTLVLQLREAMAPFSEDIVNSLENLKFDKIKPVRDTAQATLVEVGKLPQTLSPSRQSFIDSIKKKQKSSFIRDSPLSDLKKSKNPKQRDIPHTIYVGPEKIDSVLDTSITNNHNSFFEEDNTETNVVVRGRDEAKDERSAQPSRSASSSSIRAESTFKTSVEPLFKKTFEQNSFASAQWPQNTSEEFEVVEHVQEEENHSELSISSLRNTPKFRPTPPPKQSPQAVNSTPLSGNTKSTLQAKTEKDIQSDFKTVIENLSKQLGALTSQQQTLLDMMQSMENRIQQVERFVQEKGVSFSSNTPAKSQPIKSPIDKKHSPEVQDEPWKKTLEHLTIGYFEKAYSTILQHGDSLQLIRLMEKTGPVIDKLEPGTATELLMRLTQFLKTHSYIDNIFPWIRQCIDRAMIPLSVQQIKALLYALRDISAMPNSQGIDAAHLYELVTGLVAQQPHY